MRNLLKFKKSKKKIPDNSNNTTKTLKKPDIKKYVDQEGISLEKLQFGLWFIKNIKYFKYLFYSFLIIISAITWPLFIYNFGYYVVKGMKDDNKLAYDLLATDISHEVVLTQKASPLQFGALKTIKSNDNFYDFYIQAINPNDQHYAKFTFYIQTNNKKIGLGENFIFPKESKYILILSEQLDSRPSDAEFYIDKINYIRIIPKKYKDWDAFKNERLNFIIDSEVFNPANASILTEKLSLNELSFQASNNSAYNFYEVDFNILLKNSRGIAAINKYKVIDFYSGETKNINATWPGSLGAIKEIEIIPEVDITNENNYINFEGGAGEIK